MIGSSSLIADIYLSSKRGTVPVKGSEAFVPGSALCVSGSFGDIIVARERSLSLPTEKVDRMVWVIKTTAITTEGDRGGPVWIRRPAEQWVSSRSL